MDAEGARGTRQQGSGEDYIIRSFVIYYSVDQVMKSRMDGAK